MRRARASTQPSHSILARSTDGPAATLQDVPPGFDDAKGLRPEYAIIATIRRPSDGNSCHRCRRRKVAVDGVAPTLPFLPRRGRGSAGGRAPRPRAVGRGGAARRAGRRRGHDHRRRRGARAPDRRRYPRIRRSAAAGRVLRQGGRRLHEAAGRRTAGTAGVRLGAHRSVRADAGLRLPAGRHVRERRDHPARLRSCVHAVPLQVPGAVPAVRARGARRRPRPLGRPARRRAAGGVGGAHPAAVVGSALRRDNSFGPAGRPRALDDNGNGRITCAEARRHGIAPVPRGHPAYRYMRDGDGDGVVCE